MVVDGVALDVDVALEGIASIALTNGATLRYCVTQNRAAPTTMVDHKSRLEIGDGVRNVLVPFGEGSVTFSAVENGSGGVELSTFVVQTNATVDGLDVYKNVDCYIYGNIMRSSSRATLNLRSFHFGYADPDETTYIGLHMNTPQTVGSQDGFYFCCPEFGGRVKAIRPLLIENFNARPTGTDSGCTYHFGRYNPTDEVIEIVANNCKFRHGLAANNRIFVAGNTTLVLDKGSYLGNYYPGSSMDFWPASGDTESMSPRAVNIIEYGRVVLQGGSVLNSGRIHEPSANGWRIAPLESGFEAVIVSNGSYRVWTCATGSNRKGTLRIDGVCELNLPMGTVDGNLPNPLKGFGAVKVNAEGQLRLSIASGAERFLTLDTAIEGTGEVVAVTTNATDVTGKLTVAVKGGFANTFSGNLTTQAPRAEARFFFDDGATWGGVVSTSLAAITNLTTATAPSAVSFGGLRLEDESIKLRVLANHTADAIHLGEQGLEIVNNTYLPLVGDGATTAYAEPKPVLITCPKATDVSALLLRSPNGEIFRIKEVEGTTPTEKGLVASRRGSVFLFR